MGGEGGSPCGPTAVSWDPATARRPPGAIVSWPKKWAAKGAAAGLLPGPTQPLVGADHSLCSQSAR